MEIRTCIHCKDEKPVEEFKFNYKKNQKTRANVCLLCYRIQDAADHRKQTKNKNSFPDLPGEIWKDVPNYERYEASNKGRLRNKKVGNLMIPVLNDDGYPCSKLSYEKYKHKTFRIHRIIALTFIPNPNNFLEVNHIDGVKTNNCIENLEWCSRAHNVQHAFKMGLNKAFSGTKNGSSIFTIEQINEIFELKNIHKWNYSKIGRKFGIRHNPIRDICVRRTWKHLKQDDNGRWYEPD